MRSCLITRLQLRALHSTRFVFCSILIFNGLASLFADDGTDSSSQMLESLKRRSAEERWQRIKRLYPSDSSTARSNSPARLADVPVKGGFEEQVPPSPEQTAIIPRLSALPIDAANDWILPASPTTVDEGAVVPAPDVYFPSDSTSVEMPQSRSGTRIAVQDVETSTDNDQKMMQPSQRNVLSRKISDINPYYERERDTDIREFAQDKMKEYEGQFHPTPVEPRSFPLVGLNWEPSNMYYYPLYFADPALERYGHTHHPLIQPFASIARFGTQFVFLPYQMTIEPVCKQVSPVGWYLPGDVTPKLHYQAPLNAQAAAVEAGVVTGLFYIIP
jgi:hypothetical protein